MAFLLTVSNVSSIVLYLAVRYQHSLLPLVCVHQHNHPTGLLVNDKRLHRLLKMVLLHVQCLNDHRRLSVGDRDQDTLAGSNWFLLHLFLMNVFWYVQHLNDYSRLCAGERHQDTLAGSNRSLQSAPLSPAAVEWGGILPTD